MCTPCHQVTPEQHHHYQPYDDDADSHHGAIQHHLCAPAIKPCHISCPHLYPFMDDMAIYLRPWYIEWFHIWFHMIFKVHQWSFGWSFGWATYFARQNVWWNATLHGYHRTPASPSLLIRSQGRWPKRRPASPLPSQLPASRLTMEGRDQCTSTSQVPKLRCGFWMFLVLLVLQLYTDYTGQWKSPNEANMGQKIKPLVPSFIRLIHPLKRNSVWNS